MTNPKVIKLMEKSSNRDEDDLVNFMMTLSDGYVEP